MKLAALALLALTVPLAAPALAHESVSYCARLSRADHYASDGVRLTSIGQIIRQDRANFHRFGIRDAEDDSDPFFSHPDSRSALERDMNGQRLDRASIDLIVNGTPLVCVEIGGDAAWITGIY